MAVSDGVQTPTPQMVGKAFVKQYYSILHHHPNQVHRFYHNSSVMSRPEENGTMTTVTTTAEIDRKIQSLDYTNFRVVEILSADAQPSYNSSVMVLVTGCLTGTDNVKRMFAQSFFLAPRDKGFYVLNDVFRYVDAYKSGESIRVAEDIPPSQSVIADTDTDISKEASLAATIEKVPSNTQEDTHKKSFASIVKALKDNSALFHLRTSPAKPSVQPPRVHSVPAPEAPAPNMDIPFKKNNENGSRTHAIFVGNLPMTATVEQLDRVFKEFGPIKRDGILVRRNTQRGSCFGFVEFEYAASLRSALQACPPVMLDNHRLSIEERQGHDRYQNDRNVIRGLIRGRGNFGGGRSGFFNRPIGGNNTG